jgi:hypothetical protein
MNRRRFIQAVAAAGSGTAFVASRGLARVDTDGGPTTRRCVEQRWALDNIIRANGIDWDQPRSIYLSSPCGVESNGDFVAIRTSVQKLAAIGPTFENTAKRRETALNGYLRSAWANQRRGERRRRLSGFQAVPRKAGSSA